jgi:DtxR family Mn-dependent transcriptional regulator
MLTPSAEEYLEAIYRLGGQEAPVHLSKLAEGLDLSAASVNEMVRRLEEQKLVDYTPYKGVQLAQEGMCRALSVLRRHRLWERFLTDVLDLSWDIVHQEACSLEHAASEVVTEKLAEFLQQPERCPHGKPMPPPGCQPIPMQKAVPLVSMQIGQKSQVAYIAREDPELLRHLETLGIFPDVQVMIEQVAPFDGPLTVYINGVSQIIGHAVASTIYVDHITTGEAL